MEDILALIGHMDIYLVALLQSGKLNGKRTVIDLGCGGGRNLAYFLRTGWEVHGLDQQPTAIASVQELSRSLAPDNPVENFIQGSIAARPWGDKTFELVICNAVLHFSKDQDAFSSTLEAAWSAVAPGGLLFVRTASNIGLESKQLPLGNGRYEGPDGITRFLIDEAMLLHWQDKLKASLVEPIKTTVVSGQRCMTTWVLAKPTWQA